MKSLYNIIVIFVIVLCHNSAIAAPKMVKIRLTGTLYEDVEMTVGRSGRTEFISSLPYEFLVAKNDLPVRLTFRSENYRYFQIDVPQKATDDIGHVYLMKISQDHQNRNLINDNYNKDESVKPVKGIDTSKGINAAPYTGNKSENTFALIIANEEYEMATPVEMANNDGLAVKEYFIKTLGLSERQIIYVPNATYGKMRKAVRDIQSIASAYDGNINLIFYYAGHGIPDNATKDAYLMPIDADGTDVEVCYSLKKLYAEIDNMHLNQTVVLLDACFSGAKRDEGMIVAARGVAIKVKEEKPIGSTIVFAATSDEETAFSYKEEKHGLFTYFFLKEMQEKKDRLTLGDLADYITENVSRQSILINGKKQTPSIVTPQNMGLNWRKLKLTGK